jgi:cystathionine beta-lyase
MPEIKMWHLEATYLAWMDVRELNLDDPVGYFEQHGVGLSNGVDFGMKGYVRFNFGCTSAMLEEGLVRMNKAVEACR